GARECVVTPGFGNGHMHISYAHPVRGIFPDDVGSPLKHVFALQLAMTEEEEYHTSLLAILELVRNGTVCLLDPGSTKFPDACLQAYADAGVRVILGEAVTDREAPFPQPRYAMAEATARTAAFIDKWNGRLEGRVRAWARPSRCVRSRRPRAVAASARRDGCPSCSPAACAWRSAATRRTTRTTSTWCAR